MFNEVVRMGRPNFLRYWGKNSLGFLGLFGDSFDKIELIFCLGIHCKIFSF